MFPEQGRSHAEEVEWVVGVTKERWKRGAGQGFRAWGWRQSHTGSEGAVDWVVVQIDADAMSVLGMLKQEPGAGEGLLTGSADVAGWFIFICWSRERKSTLVLSKFEFNNLKEHIYFNVFMFIINVCVQGLGKCVCVCL